MTETLFEVDASTFIDEDGEYGEPGTEYVFHPESTPNGELKQQPPDRILRTPTDSQDNESNTNTEKQSLQDEMEELVEEEDCKEGKETIPEKEDDGGEESMAEDEPGSNDESSDSTETQAEESTDSEFLMKNGEVV